MAVQSTALLSSSFLLGWMKIITSCLMESISNMPPFQTLKRTEGCFPVFELFPVAAMVTFSSDQEIQEDNW